MTWNKKDLFKFTFFSFLLLSLVVVWLGFGEHGFVHLYRMEKERRSYLERITQLERENKRLLDEIHRLRTDREYIESTGRREMGLVKNDEILYRFEKKKEVPPPAEPVRKEDEIRK
ncbi:MAG: septum formation initiator family protein [Deltaproteobacteria bacterium]|nr:septum formation initiator family protein [Deltaproteobacteria bacterium]